MSVRATTASGYVTTTEGVKATGIRDLMIAPVDARLGPANQLPHAIERPLDNGSGYIPGDSRALAREIGLEPRTAPVRRPRDVPVETLEDFEGLKLRVAGRFIGEGVKGLGATPVGMGLGDIYEAVSRGQVDGMLINWAITQPFRFYEIVDYHTDEPLFQSMLMTLMSQDSYDALPPDLQAVIDANSGVEYATRMGEIWDGATQPARQASVDAGDTIITLPDEERARWKEAVQPAYDAWIAEMNAQGYDGAALFAALQEITAKYGRE